MTKQKLQQKQEPFVFSSDNLDWEEVEIKGQKRIRVKTDITTNDQDLVNDVVTQECMDSMVEQLKMRNLKLDFEHEAFRGDNKKEKETNKTKVPLGKAVGFERKPNSVEVTWELNPTWSQRNQKGEETYTYDKVVKNVKEGYYDGTSIAFIVTEKEERETKDGETVRLLKNLNLLNVALTGNAVNQNAKVKDVMMKAKQSIESKPFGDYSSFQNCVSSNQDKNDPEAYCAEIEHEITGEWPGEKEVGPGGHKPDATGPYGRGQGPGQGRADGSGLRQNEEGYRDEDETTINEEVNQLKERVNKLESSLTKLNKSEAKMTEEEQSSGEQEQEAKKQQEQQKAQEQEDQETEESEDQSSEQEDKSQELKDIVTSLQEEVKDLKSDFEELKEKLSESKKKGRVSNRDAEQKGEEVKSKEPLDLIA